MATFNELAVLIAEPLGRVLDAPFREQIKARIKYWRSKLLRDTLNRNPQERTFFTQRLTLNMQEVSAVDCGIPLDCTVMKTVEPIPSLVRANGIVFDFVGSVDGMNPFKLVRRYELAYFLKDKYAPLVTTYYSYENGYIVLPKNGLIRNIVVEGIFEDPEVAATVGCAGDGTGDCSFDETEYPISGELAQQIVQYILQVDFNRGAPNDDKTEVNVTDDNRKQ